MAFRVWVELGGIVAVGIEKRPEEEFSDVVVLDFRYGGVEEPAADV